MAYTPWDAVNNKNGLTYTVIGEAINCTNGKEHELMILYCRDGLFFVREAMEFSLKFRVKNDD